jgi:hypothetical protein
VICGRRTFRGCEASCACKVRVQAALQCARCGRKGINLDEKGRPSCRCGGHVVYLLDEAPDDGGTLRA